MPKTEKWVPLGTQIPERLSVLLKVRAAQEQVEIRDLVKQALERFLTVEVA